MVKNTYQLTVRYEVRRYETTDNDSYPRMTQDRLQIDDTFDLTDPMELTGVLRIIDHIHEYIKA